MIPRDMLEQIKARHYPESWVDEGNENGRTWCAEDEQDYPCDASRLVAFTEAVLDLAKSWDYPDPPYIPFRNREKGECADALTAIADLYLGEGNKK